MAGYLPTPDPTIDSPHSMAALARQSRMYAELPFTTAPDQPVAQGQAPTPNVATGGAERVAERNNLSSFAKRANDFREAVHAWSDVLVVDEVGSMLHQAEEDKMGQGQPRSSRPGTSVTDPSSQGAPLFF